MVNIICEYFYCPYNMCFLVSTLIVNIVNIWSISSLTLILFSEQKLHKPSNMTYIESLRGYRFIYLGHKVTKYVFQEQNKISESCSQNGDNHT